MSPPLHFCRSFVILLSLAALSACDGPATSPATRPATAPDAPRRVHVFVSGTVQGVGFRNFTQRQARPLKLTGWVKNLHDGRVEAVIEGPSAGVDKLLERIRQGPAGSRVDDVEIKEEKPSGEYSGFDVVQ